MSRKYETRIGYNPDCPPFEDLISVYVHTRICPVLVFTGLAAEALTVARDMAQSQSDMCLRLHDVTLVLADVRGQGVSADDHGYCSMTVDRKPRLMLHVPHAFATLERWQVRLSHLYKKLLADLKEYQQTEQQRMFSLEARGRLHA